MTSVTVALSKPSGCGVDGRGERANTNGHEEPSVKRFAVPAIKSSTEFRRSWMGPGLSRPA
jgi:hypothetical protein